MLRTADRRGFEREHNFIEATPALRRHRRFAPRGFGRQ
jgi:hypothetical protein